jgi:sigma-E factor negative regulatory protein RseC
MIEESARVIDIEGTQLVLEAEVKTSCQSCSAQKGCGTSLLSRHVGRKLSRFRIENTLNAKIGDEIVVGLSEQAVLRGSLLVYLFPLLSMLFAAILADALLAQQVAGRDLLVALSGFAGLGLAVLALRSKLAGARSQQQLTPVAVRKKLTVA